MNAAPTNDMNRVVSDGTRTDFGTRRQDPTLLALIHAAPRHRETIAQRPQPDAAPSEIR
jgi:hypothetical protein